MPFAGAVPSTALLLLVVLSAEEQPFKGLVPENRSVVLAGNNVTATAGAAAMCYRRSGVHEEANPSKTVLDVAPLAVCLDDTVLLPGTLLLNVNGAGSVPSPASARQSVPPPILKFSVGSCGHAFCSSCVSRYVACKLGENVARVKCPDPGCKEGAVEPESCFGIISSDLLDKWGFLLCESLLGAKTVYCPYKECSAPLLADGEAGAAAIAEAECPHCHRLFCARCAAPWHAGVGCREFQELGKDERGREDLLLRRLAGRQRWQRCPKCRMYVEKSEGCNYIKCRCGNSFCYRCASKVSALTHYCNKCKRQRFAWLSILHPRGLSPVTSKA